MTIYRELPRKDFKKNDLSRMVKTRSGNHAESPDLALLAEILKKILA